MGTHGVGQLTDDIEFLPYKVTRLNPRTPRPVAIRGFFRQGDLCIISASWDSFKSTFASEIAYSLATCEPLFGNPHWIVERPVKTAILQAELDPGSYDLRLEAFPRSPAMDKNFFHFSDLDHRNGHRKFRLNQISRLIKPIKQNNIQCLILDPIGQMWPNTQEFNPNSGMQVSPILWDLKMLGITVFMVHHDPKPGQGLQNRASGSASLLNDPDTRMFLDREKDGKVRVIVRSRLQNPVAPFWLRYLDGRLVLHSDLTDE